MNPLHWSRFAVIIVIVGLSLLWWLGWLAAFFYRQIQIDRLSESFASLPNEFSHFETIDGVKLHYLVQGKGPDILLLHGLAANVFTWRELMPLLATYARVWALDIKGFGLSDKPRHSKYDLSSQATLILHFMASKGISKYSIIGNSMGGAIAAQMAVQKPEVIQELVLINSAHDPRFLPLAASMLKVTMGGLGYASWLLRPLVVREVAEIFIERWLYGNVRKVPAEVVNAYIRPYMEGHAAIRAFLQALSGLSRGVSADEIKKLSIKPLILLGKNDRIMPSIYGQELHEKLPESRLEIHASGGHHLQEEDPLWISQHIQKLLN